jgi:hypothetical protein
MMWRKSSRSTADANCVEVARLTEPITAVRDSKNANGPTLTFPTPAWSHFLHRAR